MLRVLRAFAGSLLLFTPLAHAVLGEGRLQSGVGQPLRLAVPTVGVPQEDIEPRCIRVFRSHQADGIPFPNDLRIDVEESGGVKRVFARTRVAVQEPVIRFGLEWTCGASFRREYTVLLDPIPVSEINALPMPPALPSAPITSNLPNQDGRLVTLNERARGGIVANATPRPPRPRAPRIAEGAEPMPRARAVSAQSRLAIRGGMDGLARDLDLAVLSSPQLRLSTLLTLGGVASKPMSDVDRAVMASRRERLLRAPIESDLRPQLEVDLMIAQKRIQELQARIVAADPKGLTAPASQTQAYSNPEPVPQPVQMPVGVAQAPTTPAPEAAKPATSSATPQPQAVQPPVVKAKSRDVAPEGGSFATQLLQWIWLPALAAIGAFAWSLIWLRKKRAQESQERAYAAAAAAVGLSPTLDGEMEHSNEVNTRARAIDSLINPGDSAGPDSVRTLKLPRHEAGGDSMPRRVETPIGMTTIRGGSMAALGPTDLSAELFQPNFDTAQLGVSMVSAVTEEASVYVELGRVEEGIAVLKDHIDLERAYARVTPAPWLMLLDLYHRSDNRSEFESLRAEFMKNFNGRIPEWGAFEELHTEKALLEHDHIVERLIRYWSTPKCHEYIQKLLYDHRDNSRIGFSLTAYRELVMLDTIHGAAFPSSNQAPIEIPKADD